MTLVAGEEYYLYMDGGGNTYDSDTQHDNGYPYNTADFDVTHGAYTLDPQTTTTRAYNFSEITAITDSSTAPMTLGASYTAPTTTLEVRTETTPRGFRFVPDVNLDGLRLTINTNVANQTRAFIRDTNKDTVIVEDISGLVAGDTFDLITAGGAGGGDVTNYLTWGTNADWDAAQRRRNVVTRFIGARSGDEIWQGWDPNYHPTGLARCYWPLDETDTLVTGVEDVIGAGDGDRVNGPSLGNDGLIGSNAIGFDGVDDYINLYQPAEMNDSGSFSVVMGVRRDTLNDRQNLMSHGFNQAGDWSFEVRDNSRLYAFYGDTTGTLNGGEFHAGDMTTGWHLVALVYHGNGEATVWLDGVSQTRSLGGSGRPSPSGGNAAIGRFGERGYYHFDGLLSDVFYFDGAISSNLYLHMLDTLEDGTLTTGKQTYDGAAVSAEVSADIHPNADATMTVHLDSSGDGTANTTETVTLANGTNTYDLTTFNAGGDYWARFDLSNTTPQATAKIKSAALEMGEIGGAGSVARTDNGVLLLDNGVILTQ